MSKKNTHKGRSGNPAKRPTISTPPITWKDWVGAARLRTLPLAISPVVLGTGAAQLVDPEFHWLMALACLAVSVFMQIGVNYANDYSDGVRGTDAYRVGPRRLTASGKVNPKKVLATALVFFALAAAAGVTIVIRTEHWWLLGVGAACILAGWFYTGGKRPYGYAALGEVFVFIFFGLVATVGTAYVQAPSINPEAWFVGAAAGAFAVAVLLANNLRDITQDRKAGKRTLSTFIGKRATQVLFTIFILAPFGLAVWFTLLYPITWMSLLALLAALPAVLIVWTYREPRELVIALSLTSLTSLAWAGVIYWSFVG